MKKINKILIGTHNEGKYKEISALLPKGLKRISPSKFGIQPPIQQSFHNRCHLIS